jgi:hypothetical protein
LSTICGTAGADQPPGKDFQLLGTIRTRPAREIAGSSWSVGAETMDRDFTVYANWRQYLGPLGAKAARVQSGWAKTEKTKDHYDWAWIDAILPDMVAQGVKPWVCLCYGNPIYEGGGGTGLGGGLPSSEAALTAWDRYVAAFVARYGRYVDQWEIWNEPAGKAEPYAALIVRTARVVRRVQPRSQIIAAAWGDVRAILEYLKQRKALGLVDEFTYHPYTYNPDKTYGLAQPRLRDLLASYDPRLRLRQGENGAPSQPGSFGAIAKYDWNEERQAKWALRRLLGDLGRDIPSSYFSICDMQYPDRRNYKGLLAINDDKTVNHAKQAYYAYQRVTAIFDNTLRRIEDFAGGVQDVAKEQTYSVFAYRNKSGASIVTLWRDRDRPGEHPEIEQVTLSLPGITLARPVWVDLLTGRVYRIPAGLKSESAGTTVFRDLPAYDSVVLIAEQDAIPLAANPK